MAATTTQETVEQRIFELLEELGAEPSAIRRDATFVDLQIDSLDLVEMAQIVEDEYGVKITPEDAMTITNVGEAIELIASRIQ